MRLNSDVELYSPYREMHCKSSRRIATKRLKLTVEKQILILFGAY